MRSNVSSTKLSVTKVLSLNLKLELRVLPNSPQKLMEIIFFQGKKILERKRLYKKCPVIAPCNTLSGGGCSILEVSGVVAHGNHVISAQQATKTLPPPELCCTRKYTFYYFWLVIGTLSLQKLPVSSSVHHYPSNHKRVGTFFIAIVRREHTRYSISAGWPPQ